MIVCVCVSVWLKQNKEYDEGDEEEDAVASVSTIYGVRRPEDVGTVVVVISIIRIVVVDWLQHSTSGAWRIIIIISFFLG